MQEKKLTGYPSIDKPWLKYYSEEAINAPLPECTIYEYLWENNKDHLDDIAIIYFNRKITYGELFHNIDRTAAAFLAQGVKPKDVVTLMFLNCPETVYCFYALNKIGAVACVVNVLSNVGDLLHYLRECNSKYSVTLDVFYDKAFEAAKEYGVKSLIHFPLYQSLGWFKMAAYRTKVKEPKSEDNFVLSWNDFINAGKDGDIAPSQHEKGKCTLIGHTGGTTGIPKAIMLTDNSVNYCVFQFINKWRHARGDKFLNLVVPFAVYGFVMNIHMPLVCGMKCILIPKVDPKKTDKLMLKYKPNHIISVPSYWTAIAENKKIKDVSFLKIAGAGGSKMEPRLENELNQMFKNSHSDIHFMNGYGMSEVGSIASAQSNDCAEIGSVGIPLMHNIISSFDPETYEEKKIGEEGELCILSPSMMIGYVDNEEENGKVMKRHSDGKVWIHTGDLGYISVKGSVFITGRIKRIYITQVNGTVSKIFPDRIEKLISENKAVSNCCAVCRGDAKNTYYPIVFVVLKQEEAGKEEIIKAELKKECANSLPDYAQPTEYIFTQSLPLTSVGKIDYRALEKLAEEMSKK